VRGQGFGRDRRLVDGKVVVAGAEVRDYLDWRRTEVVVLVPNGAAIGLGQDVYLITAGGFDRASVSVSAAPC
jgi:hypothetical protein